MLFNSLSFIIFLPIVYTLYWLLSNKGLKFQNILLLISSYFFYACWDYRFLFLLIFSTLLDYFTGLKIFKSKDDFQKKTWLWISIFINLGFLGLFKYYNFFANSFVDAFSIIGIHIDLWTLKIVLPVGISFYTFHGLSYVIDIYKNRIEAEKNFVNYSVFVSFFPLLVAGPIERATHLLPQIKSKRAFHYTNSIQGLKQILWGVFKKVVIADNCSDFANYAFGNSDILPGSSLFLGAVFFSIQIYGDFSGYSDIAIGTAKLFGINLIRNFSYPYFSRDIAEFWRRWHISLSSWFRDYLYIPLGGSKGGNLAKIRNIFIIFLVSGFWHGANWTFVFWGFLNALFIIPSIILNSNRNNLDIVAKGRLLPSFKEFFSIFFTFGLTVFAWIFFRAESLSKAKDYIFGILSSSILSPPILPDNFNLTIILILVVLFFLIEWLGRESEFAISSFFVSWNWFFRWLFYFFLIFIIGLFMKTSETPFIYFNF